MNTIGSPFFVVSCLIAPTIPPTVTTSPSRRRSSSTCAQSTFRRSCSRIADSGCSETYRPSVSFSSARSSLFSNSSRGIGGWWRGALRCRRRRRGRRSSPARRSGRPARGRPRRARSRATSSIPFRVAPVESSAPQLISASSARLFATCGSTRSVKSQIDSNGPPSSRAAMIARAAESPTFLTAFRPKRIFPSTTAKSHAEELTSGGSTSMPISRHAFT